MRNSTNKSLGTIFVFLGFFLSGAALAADVFPASASRMGRNLQNEISSGAPARHFISLRDRLRLRTAAARGADAGPLDDRRTALIRDRWRAVEPRQIVELALLEGCDDGRCIHPLVERAAALSRRLRGKSLGLKVRAIHTFIRRHIRAEKDPAGTDRWSTPLETLTRGDGDCEDMAMLARAMLALSGLDETRLGLVVADQPGRGLHAIATVRLPDGRRLLVDPTQRNGVRLAAARDALVLEL